VGISIPIIAFEKSIFRDAIESVSFPKFDKALNSAIEKVSVSFLEDVSGFGLCELHPNEKITIIKERRYFGAFI
jgi:hypothetical protein